MTYDDIQHPRINPFTGTPEVDPDGQPDHRPRENGHQPQQLHLRRAGAGVLLAVPGHGSGAAELLHRFDPRSQRPDFRHADPGRFRRLSDCSACATRRRAPSGPSAPTTSASAVSPAARRSTTNARLVRRAREHRRLRRRLGYQGPRARQPRSRPPRRAAREEISAAGSSPSIGRCCPTISS